MPLNRPLATATINVLIAGDRLVVREGLMRIVEQCAGAKVVGQAATRNEVLAQARATDPDVLLLDAFLDTPTLLGLLRELRRHDLHCRTLVLNVEENDTAAPRILEAGAAGYLRKDHSLAQLIEAIHDVAHGVPYVSSSLAGRLLGGLRGSATGPRHRALSDREYEVLCMFATGIPFKEIAGLFGVSPKTVSTYRSRILTKLKLESNAAMIRYAIEHHLVRSSTALRAPRRKTLTE